MMREFSSIAEVWSYLEDIPKFQDKGATASNFGLDSIKHFCEEIGNPHHSYPSIHVAGTNGKGSTCYLLESVCQKVGLKTGMFTSPHLIRYNERFRVNGREVEDELILLFFNQYSELIEKHSLTFFEISTALVFWLFREEKVDVAIIETGLGGRLDSTNIITPLLSIISSIGFDHQDVLGSTIEEIAFEKAGIIKENVPVILGNIHGSAEEVITKIAKERHAPVYKVSELNPDWERGEVVFEGQKFTTLLTEEVNKWNIGSALLASKVLDKLLNLSEDDFREVLHSFSAPPGRFERLSQNKNWYFSGAHNKEAIVSTLKAAEKLSDVKPTIVLSLMSDKLNISIKELFSGYKVYYHQLDIERAAITEKVETLFEIEEITENNKKTILNELETSLVIFTGSFYFYSTVKRWVNKN